MNGNPQDEECYIDVMFMGAEYLSVCLIIIAKRASTRDIFKSDIC